MLRQDDGLRNQIATDWAALWNGGKVEIYSGGQPADPDDAPTGTLICTINLPTPAFSVVGPTVSKTGVWSGVAGASATAGWARVYNAAEDQWFDITVAEAGADLTIDDEDILIGGTVVVTAFSYTVPA